MWTFFLMHAGTLDSLLRVVLTTLGRVARPLDLSFQRSVSVWSWPSPVWVPHLRAYKGRWGR